MPPSRRPAASSREDDDDPSRDDSGDRSLDDLDLDNNRTLLAAERTYAAWMRTGLSIAAGGIAIVRLLPDPRRHTNVALAIGGAFVLLGVAIILFGARPYAGTTRRLDRGGRPRPTTPRAAYLITGALALRQFDDARDPALAGATDGRQLGAMHR